MQCFTWAHSYSSLAGAQQCMQSIYKFDKFHTKLDCVQYGRSSSSRKVDLFCDSFLNDLFLVSKCCVASHSVFENYSSIYCIDILIKYACLWNWRVRVRNLNHNLVRIIDGGLFILIAPIFFAFWTLSFEAEILRFSFACHSNDRPTNIYFMFKQRVTDSKQQLHNSNFVYGVCFACVLLSHYIGNFNTNEIRKYFTSSHMSQQTELWKMKETNVKRYEPHLRFIYGRFRERRAVAPVHWLINEFLFIYFVSLS